MQYFPVVVDQDVNLKATTAFVVHVSHNGQLVAPHGHRHRLGADPVRAFIALVAFEETERQHRQVAFEGGAIIVFVSISQGAGQAVSSRMSSERS